MILIPIPCDEAVFPTDLKPLLSGAKLYDSSCSKDAKVIFVDKDGGYFLKSAPKGDLKSEALMTQYLHRKGLSAKVLAYLSDDIDWLVTEKVRGEDCIASKYLENPKRLCDTLAECLVTLHSTDVADCPIQNRTADYLATVSRNYTGDNFEKSQFPDSFGFSSAEEAWNVVSTQGHLLASDTLLHGDYCLPNIILNEWSFGGFIDVGNGGVGDRHIDLFWGAWSLCHNLKSEKYRDRFFDAYGRDKIDEEVLRIVAAAEVFG